MNDPERLAHTIGDLEAALDSVGGASEVFEPECFAKPVARVWLISHARTLPTPGQAASARAATRRLPTRMITPDQRATLQLLLERGQTYADLAALLGQDEADVRARARAALTELVGTDPDKNVGITDYLLGQADPIGRADASRHLRDDPADHKIATELAVRLRLMFPTAELPRLPGEPRQAGGGLLRRGPSAASGAEAPAGGPRAGRGGLTESQGRLVLISSIGAVLLVVIVLAITGAFSGDDEAGGTASDGATTTATTPDEQLQSVDLEPIGGGDASGTAVFGLATGDQPYIDLDIRGLDPAPGGQTYVAWLMLTEEEGYPLSPIVVSQNGSYQNRFAIPSAVLPVIARVQYVDVSIAPIKTIERLIRDAIDNTELVLTEPGEKILRGAIPAGATGQGGGAQDGAGQGGGT